MQSIFDTKLPLYIFGVLNEMVLNQYQNIYRTPL